MEIGERIRRLRKDRHMTQEELAHMLGLQKSAIAKYEKGRVSNIKKATLLKLSLIHISLAGTKIRYNRKF